MKGHKEDGVFHPHDNKPKGIHSTSINGSTSVTDVGVKKNGSKPKEDMPKLTSRQKEIYDKFMNNEPLSKSDVQVIKNALNSSTENAQEFGKMMNDKIWNRDGETKIDSAHTQQGIDWLKKSAQKNKMGYREQEAVDEFDHFGLAGFTDIANYDQVKHGIHWYEPVWDVFGKDNSYFQYHMSRDGISIVG